MMTYTQAAYDLVVDGRSISPTVRPRLMSLRLSEKRGADADELEIVLNDADGRVQIPPAGATITLKLGAQDLVEGGPPILIDKGSFKVDERGHDGAPDRVTIRAKAADLTAAFRNRRDQTWSDTTLGEILGDVAARNSLQPAVSADKAAIAITHLNQSRESDSALLARLGRLHDAVATVKDGRLLFAAIGSGRSAASDQVLPAFEIRRQDGDRHRWSSAEREKYGGSIAEWQDRGSAERKRVVVGSEENAKKLGRVYGSEASARRAAEAHRSSQKRKQAQFSIDLARGRPDLYPDRKGSVAGFKAEIDDSKWLIAEAIHTVDGGGGLRTSLQMEIGEEPKDTSRS